MKLKTTTDKGRAGSPLPAVREQAEVRRRARSDAPYQRGIALVVTLILISVIGFMAITFLVLSQRERGAVSVAASQTDTRLAAETALQTAIAKLLAPVIAYTNSFDYDLLVSTNYSNPDGFFTGNNYPTNVNYDYRNGGGTLTVNDSLENIANLQYEPRPPVFVVTNKQTGGADFRYYLDLNRNHAADPSGFLPETNNLNQPTGNTNYFVGDPEWIGILERPELPHSANNKFIARYAYIAVPASKTLDLNHIHNQAKNPTKLSLDTFGGDFLRNQGVGSWEINLAAFLFDLNTNIYGWGGNYTYDPLASGAVSGNAFINAESLYRYRLNGVTGIAYNNLANVNNLFNGTAGPTLFGQDMIDQYTDGLLQTGVGVAGENDNSANPWPGADNPNHFFTTQDLFDASKTSVDFTDRLSQVGTNNSSYDRYTFTRLLSQLGTDSSAESGKLNLNYLNVDTNTGVVVPNAETNYVSWTPIQFFTNVASRLLANMASQPEFSREFGTNSVRITNIMVWPTNDYTPAVHRTLQLAANLYDATTNHSPLSGNLSAPVVFRPLFSKISSTVFITGYEEVTNSAALISTNTLMRDPKSATDMAAAWGASDMVYGFPLVIGAKKGFPNFNALAIQTAVRATRKLQVSRPTTNSLPDDIRQIYLLGISNIITVSGWNSYSNVYPLGVQIIVAADVITVLTNEVTSNNGVIPTTYGTGLASNRYSVGYITNIAASSWAGFKVSRPTPSFRIPLTNIFMSLTNSAWQSVSPASSIGYFTSTNVLFNQTGLTPPHWWMSVSTRLRFIMVDSATSRILDYVNLSTDAPVLDVTGGLMQGTDCANPGADASDGGVWCTNKPASYPPMIGANIPTYGVINQLSISRGSLDVPTRRWALSKTNEIAAFNLFMGGRGSTNLIMQAPFTAFRLHGRLHRRHPRTRHDLQPARRGQQQADT